MLEAADRIPWLRKWSSTHLSASARQLVDTEDFDIDPTFAGCACGTHVHLMSCPIRCPEAMAEFDRARPPWEFTLVEGFDGDVPRSFRSSTMRRPTAWSNSAGREILDPEREPKHGQGADVSTVQAKELRRPNRLESAVSVLDQRPPRRWHVDRDGQIDVANRTIASSHNTVRNRDTLLGCAPRGTDHRAAFTGHAFAHEQAWLRCVRRRLRGAARRSGTSQRSLNDAFIAGVMAGLRRYHDGCGLPVSELRMTLPISVRGKDDTLAGNRFVPVRFTVPVTAPDTATSVATISRLVREWRNGPALTLTDTLAAALNVLPTAELTQVFRSLLRNVDFVATNVPGLPRRPTLPVPRSCGNTRSLPQVVLRSMSHCSNVDCCCIGVNMDRGAIDDPQLLMRSLHEGFEEVLALSAPADPSAHSHLQGVGS